MGEVIEFYGSDALLEELVPNKFRKEVWVGGRWDENSS